MGIFRLILALGLAFAPVAAWSACQGRDLLAGFSAAERAALEAASAAHPHAEGRFFEVSRDGARSVLFGTMHMTDPQIATPPPALEAEIETARVLMLEVTRAEEARMQAAMMRDPSLIIARDGARLRPHLTDAEWAALSDILSGYGMPAAMADRIAPWFLTIMLSIPACVLEAQAAGGTGQILDRRIEALAEARGVAVKGLERYETLFSIMAEGDHDEHVEMLRLALPTLRHSEDILATSRQLYLDGEVMKIWELGRMMLERDMDSGQARAIMDQNAEALLSRRNTLWMDEMVPELASGGAVVAVGALHLGGEDGRAAVAGGAGVRSAAVGRLNARCDGGGTGARPGRFVPLFRAGCGHVHLVVGGKSGSKDRDRDRRPHDPDHFASFRHLGPL